MTRASIVVVSWNGAEYLPACLRALTAQTRADDELIVVDNASTDGSAELVRSAFPSVSVITNEQNLGFAGGANVGLQAAQGESLLLVNQDVVVRSGWLDAVLADLHRSDVGIVGSKLLYPNGRIQHAGGALHYPLALPDHFGYRDADRGQWDEPRDVDFVTGAAIGIARGVVESVGLFDEGFHPAYYEETDLCTRARAAGFRVCYAANAVAVHEETASVSRESTDYHRWMARGRLRYVLKHYTAMQFRRDFLPAERMWGASLSVPAMREGLRLAYLDTLLDLRQIPRTGVLAEAETVAPVAEALTDLRSLLSRLSTTARHEISTDALPSPFAQPGGLPGGRGSHDEGRIRAMVRRLRSSIEHRWYLRHLFIRKELRLTQETVAALDREAVEAYRVVSQTLYGLRAALDGIEGRVEALETTSAVRATPEERP